MNFHHGKTRSRLNSTSSNETTLFILNDIHHRNRLFLKFCCRKFWFGCFTKYFLLQNCNDLVVVLFVGLRRCVQFLILLNIELHTLLPIRIKQLSYEEVIAPLKLINIRTVVADVCANARNAAAARFPAERTVHEGILRDILFKMRG